MIDETHQVRVILEGEVKVCDPAPIAEHEDVTFFLEACRLCPLQHLPLVQDLERVDPVGVFELDDADLAEGTAADHLQDLEVVLAKAKRLDAVGHRLNWKRKFQIENLTIS